MSVLNRCRRGIVYLLSGNHDGYLRQSVSDYDESQRSACLLFLTNTSSRRKYYIGNYAATGLYSVATVAVAAWVHVQISAYKVQYLTTVDFEALKSFSETWGRTYIESTFWLDLHYFVAGLGLLSVAALVVNLVWKIKMMRGEAALIAQGKEAAV